MAALAAMPALKALGKRMDPRNYNGASFVGVNGIVIKSHGSADAQAFVAAIRVALREVENEVPSRIARLLADACPARVQDTKLACSGPPRLAGAGSSDRSRGGEGGVSTCRSRWWRYNAK